MPSSHFGRTVAIAALILLAVSVSGCGVNAGPENTPRPGTSRSTGTDAAMTCGAAAVLLSNLHNADSDYAAGRITEAEWATMVDLAKTDFDGIHRFTDWGLQEQVQAITEYMATSATQPSGAGYDSTSDEFGGLVNDLRNACEANRTPISTFATSGG